MVSLFLDGRCLGGVGDELGIGEGKRDGNTYVDVPDTVVDVV